MANNIKLSRLFGEGMVLQRGKTIRIWGRTIPLNKVTVIFRECTECVSADEDGRFEVRLPSMNAGGPHRMRILTSQPDAVEHSAAGQESAGNDCGLVIEEVYTGDVWICSGQSNMDLPVTRIKDRYPDESFACKDNGLRIFKVDSHYTFHGPLEAPESGSWKHADKDTIPDFSAFSYFFARYIKEGYREEGLQIPVGIINVSVGGSPIEAWMAAESLSGREELAEVIRLCKDDSYVSRFTEIQEHGQQLWREMVEQKEQEQLEKETQEKGQQEKVLQNKVLQNIVQPFHTPDDMWKPITLPGWFSDAGLKDFCGSIWLRRHFTVPEHMAGKPASLWLGTIVDSDRTWVNARYAGETGYQYPPRKYTIERDVLTAGDNELLVRVLVERGLGRFTPDKEYRIFGEDCEIDLSGDWEYRVGAQTEPAPEMDFIIRKPSGLYNGMLASCLPYTVKGIVWYQGESNDRRAGSYLELLEEMIRSVREQVGEELPFILVQLPGFSIDLPPESGWPVIREAQRRAAMNLPKTAMTVNLDLGEWNDLHPLRKREAAYRAAMAARSFDAQDTPDWQGPVPESVERQSDRFVITFNHTQEVLEIRDAAGDQTNVSEEFEAAGSDSIYRHISGIADGRSIILNDRLAPQIRTIRYAYRNYPMDGLLFNRDGFPASPFVIELGPEDEY